MKENFSQLKRSEISAYLKKVKFSEDFLLDFQHSCVIKDLSVNLVRVRYGPSGVDGIITNDITFAMEKYKHWNCDWIEIIDEPPLKPVYEMKSVEE